MDAPEQEFAPYQLRATRTLLRFCEEHGHAPTWLEELRRCAAALESRNEPAVRESYAQLRCAGMCSFLDWGPTAAAPEDQEYLQEIWVAVYRRWADSLSPFGPEAK